MQDLTAAIANANSTHTIAKSATNTLAGLIPGYEARRIQASARFSMRPSGGAIQRLKTPGRVPEETRPYQAGDPFHLIDWRAFGRTDQLILRQRREQAPQHVRIQMGQHDSMHWPLTRSGDQLLTKSELAWRLALFISFALMRRGDIVELAIEGGPVWRPSGTRMIGDLFTWLKDRNFESNKIPNNILPELSQAGDLPLSPRIRRVILSDALEKAGSHWMQVLRPGDLFLHVLADQEVSDAWRSGADVFTDDDVDGSSGAARAAMHEWQGQHLETTIESARALWFEKMNLTLKNQGVDAIRLTGSVPVDAFLVLFESWCGGSR